MPQWWEDAACAGYPPTWWDTDPGYRENREQAVAICYRCPVQDLCYDDAMSFETQSRYPRWGIWGGTSPAERSRVARGEREPWTCAHGHPWSTRTAIWRRGYRDCRACRISASAASAPPPASP